MFSKSQQKRQVIGDLRVCTGFGLKKQHCWNLWSVLPSCSVWSQPQLDERGLYVWFALMYTPPDSYRKGRSCRTAEKREEARILKSSRLKVHLHGHSPPPLIYWSRHFHLLKLENVLKYRCWKLYADLHTFVNKQRPDCVHAKSLAPLKFFALVSSRVGGRKNMKFNFVHNWQIHISWQKPQFHPW